MILFLFLSHLAHGIIFTLVFVSREAGVKFFRFNAGLASILLVIAIGFSQSLGVDPFSRWALVTSAGAIAIYWATVGRTLASIRPLLVSIAVGAGLVAIVSQAFAAVSGHGLGLVAMTIASFLSSAALLGGACTAMILGHWYLVIPSMRVSHLQSIVKLHMASMVVRTVVVAAAVFLAIATWQPGLGPSFRHYILSVSG